MISFDFSIGAMRCANGETWEFFLTRKDASGKVYRAFPGGAGIFRTVELGDDLMVHAWQAFREMVLGDHVHMTGYGDGVMTGKPCKPDGLGLAL